MRVMKVLSTNIILLALCAACSSAEPSGGGGAGSGAGAGGGDDAVDAGDVGVTLGRHARGLNDPARAVLVQRGRDGRGELIAT
jgi:hypothetical protein